MNTKYYLAYHNDLNETASHQRIASDKTISRDTRDGMLFTARQILDIMVCLKSGEIPDDKQYTFNEITLWQACRKVLLNDNDFIESMRGD
jgi:hypothetical protein